jgi:large subunit ribosomal protein L6
MSRIGKQPIEIPSGVDVKLQGRSIEVKGSKGHLTFEHHPDITVVHEDGVIRVTRPSDEPRHRALHGLTRTLVANMIEGVANGFSKTLEIIGVGYRAEAKGKGVVLRLGFSHLINYDAPDGVQIQVPNPTTMVVEGADKQKVGQVAAELRGFRPPEPYKGKGVRYKGEYVRRKAGKTAGA